MNPSWHDIVLIAGALIVILLGIIISMIGFYAKSLGHRVDLLEVHHKGLNDLVLSQYHNKDEIRDLLGEIKSSIAALHKRFDLVILQKKE